MTLADNFQERLASWKPSGEGRHSWSESFPDAGWAVHLAADHNDVVATLVWELTLARTVPAPAGLTLKAWAGQIAERVSGLMEDLKLIEVDDARQEAVLRSEDPSRKGDLALYYEVRLYGLSRAVVRRYHADTAAATRREQIAFPLTHEALAKLAGDIAG
jgi:hypothetical protein